jgi:hypothetical protein
MVPESIVTRAARVASKETHSLQAVLPMAATTGTSQTCETNSVVRQRIGQAHIQ